MVHQIWLRGSLTSNSYVELKSQLAQLQGECELHVNSTGGEVLGVQELADYIYSRRHEIKAFIHGSCSSSAYWITCACGSITACSETTLIGGIGVKIEHIDKSKALESNGIKLTELSTGSMKTVGTEARPLTPAEKSYLQDEIDKMYKIFLGFVAKTREIPIDKISSWQGKEFIGKEALSLGLIDNLGDSKMEELELLKKENEELKLKIAELIKKLEELQPPAPPEGECNKEEDKMLGERHRVLALMSLNKGEKTNGLVMEAISRGWSFSTTVDAILAAVKTTQNSMKATSQIVPNGVPSHDVALANLVAKAGK